MDWRIKIGSVFLLATFGFCTASGFTYNRLSADRAVFDSMVAESIRVRRKALDDGFRRLVGYHQTVHAVLGGRHQVRSVTVDSAHIPRLPFENEKTDEVRILLHRYLGESVRFHWQSNQNSFVPLQLSNKIVSYREDPSATTYSVIFTLRWVHVNDIPDLNLDALSPPELQRVIDQHVTEAEFICPPRESNTTLPRNQLC